jgi:hypothetical protein
MKAMNKRGCHDVFASLSCCGGIRMMPPVVMKKIHFENTTLPR